MEQLTNMILAIDQYLDNRWGPALITAGLLLDALGAVLLASVLIVGKDEAIKRATATLGATQAVYGALLRDSKRGKWGAALLVSGFGLQIWGVWL